TGKPTPPLARAVVDAVARRDNARLLVDGMTAANDLGLTTAVPAQVTVFTDARLRPIQLGAQQIRFKQAAPSRLYWAGHPAMRVVQALYWTRDLLPSDGPDVLRKLRNMIVHAPDGPAIAFDLQAGLPTLPTWMQTRVRDLLAKVGFQDLRPRTDPADDRHRMAPITGPAGAAG
ncbi:MAG TPA: DUF6088 family protein, partial [Phenylobacterium sp.]|nr:DUF6088 family protein [Phenylobacterium sp.]